jgi:hypothetical protein
MCAEGSGEAILAADVGRAGVNAFVTVLVARWRWRRHRLCWDCRFGVNGRKENT